MKMIGMKSKEFKSIGYNDVEKAIYVKDMLDIIRVFENKSKEEFEQFMYSKQQDYFYLFVLRSLDHKTMTYT